MAMHISNPLYDLAAQYKADDISTDDFCEQVYNAVSENNKVPLPQSVIDEIERYKKGKGLAEYLSDLTTDEPSEDLPYASRQWTCPRCHTHHDRDINAAKNILVA